MALEWRETEHATVVVPEQKVEQPAAETTDAVVQD
jgi:hypothetical protein